MKPAYRIYLLAFFTTLGSLVISGPCRSVDASNSGPIASPTRLAQFFLDRLAQPMLYPLRSERIRPGGIFLGLTEVSDGDARWWNAKDAVYCAFDEDGVPDSFPNLKIGEPKPLIVNGSASIEILNALGFSGFDASSITDARLEIGEVVNHIVQSDDRLTRVSSAKQRCAKRGDVRVVYSAISGKLKLVLHLAVPATPDFYRSMTKLTRGSAEVFSFEPRQTSSEVLIETKNAVTLSVIARPEQATTKY